TGSHRLNDGIAMRCENCALGTRRIVLRQRTDRLEQGATDIVVEILGRNDRRSGKQPGNKCPSLIVRIGVGVAAVEQADAGGRRVLGDGMQCGGRLGHERSVKCRSRVVEKVQKTLRRWPTLYLKRSGISRTNPSRSPEPVSRSLDSRATRARPKMSRHGPPSVRLRCHWNIPR